jgi:hypothetical protein
MSHGGLRQGAGRKKGQSTLIREQIRAKIAEMIKENEVPLIQKQIDKALEGDTSSFRELFDRAFGKAQQALITEDEDGNDVPLFSEFVKLSETAISQYLQNAKIKNTPRNNKG